MHLETLKVFCDVVETRSFSVAASQNFVTQSAVSQQIRTLEERYGRRLLERTRGNVQLTPAGEILYQVSKEIVQRYQDMEAQLQVVAQRVAGTVRVATVHSIGLYELSVQIKRYLKAYPQVHLHLEYSRSNKIYETDRLLRRYGVEVRYVMELDNVETIKRVVEIGTGLAILPEPAVRPEVKNKTLVAVHLSDELFLRPLGIIHRQGKHFSPATEKFIEFLRAE